MLAIFSPDHNEEENLELRAALSERRIKAWMHVSGYRIREEEKEYIILKK